MRTSAYALLLLTLTGLGFYLGWRRGSPTLPGGTERVERPRALEEAWRAWFERRPADLDAALARGSPADGTRPALQDEARLLRALGSGQREALLPLAEGRSASTPSVIAAAQRELARSAPDPEERNRWVERLRLRFPRSWTLRSASAFEPR